MVKMFRLAIATVTIPVATILWSGLVASFPRAAFGEPSPQFAFPPISTTEEGQAFCYLHLADGRAFNLNRLCGSSVSHSSDSNNSDDAAYPSSLLNTANHSGDYGTTPSRGYGLPTLGQPSGNSRSCFLFDAEGHPCPQI